MTLCLVANFSKSPFCQVLSPLAIGLIWSEPQFDGQSHCDNGDTTFLIYQVTTCSKGCVTFWKFCVEASHRVAKTDGHRSCAIKVITDLRFHLTLQYHVTLSPL